MSAATDLYNYPLLCPYCHKDVIVSKIYLILLINFNRDEAMLTFIRYKQDTFGTYSECKHSLCEKQPIHYQHPHTQRAYIMILCYGKTRTQTLNDCPDFWCVNIAEVKSLFVITILPELMEKFHVLCSSIP